MNGRPLHIGLFCDREDWITGTAVRQIATKLAPLGFAFTLTSQRKLYADPAGEVRRLRRCHAIHWLSPYGWTHFGPMFLDQPQLCNIHHCLPGDEHRSANYTGARIVTMSEASRRALIERGFKEVQIVRYGVDADLFRPLDRAACRRALGLDSVTFPLVGFFGKGSSNPADRKGTDVLFRTLEQINRRRQVGVLLSGEGWDTLAAQFQAAGIPVFQRRPDRLEEMPTLYGAADVYLCVSRVEGGPVPVLEALACERPTISTPVGHVPELLNNGENGLAIPVNDPQAAAEAVEAVLDDPVLAGRLAQAGRQTILQSWTWEAVLRPLADIYRAAATVPAVTSGPRPKSLLTLVMLLARSWKYRLAWAGNGGRKP